MQLDQVLLPVINQHTVSYERMFKRIKISCLETLDELKEKCKQKGIRIVRYNYDRHLDELGIKRVREPADIDGEKKAKRQKTENGRIHKNGLLQLNGTLINVTSKHQNGVQNSVLQVNGKIQIIHNVSQVNTGSENGRKEHVQVESNRTGYYFKASNLNETPEKIKLVIQSLDNREELENQFKFYEQLSHLETELNKQLVKGKNKTVTIRNIVDMQLPPSFTYINEYLLDFLDKETLQLLADNVQKCNCKNECVSFSKNIQACCYSSFGDRIFYDSQGLIKSRVTKRGPIIECTKNCSCSDKCPNRIIQNGTQVRLEIFKTSDGRGWGLKTLERIPKNKFICTYRGEVITSEEALVRQTSSQYRDKYFFDLDYNEDLNFKYVVDATHRSNLGRYLNHSCLPNCETFVAYVEHAYMPIPVIAFFTNRLIKENEELTIDYYMGAQNPTNFDSNTVCLCNTPHCRKYAF